MSPVKDIVTPLSTYTVTGKVYVFPFVSVIVVETICAAKDTEVDMVDIVCYNLFR
jgi:hypothetical protein